MADVVFVLGAGFNCSTLDSSRGGGRPPLARNFFQALLEGRGSESLDGYRRHVYVDVLLEEIERYWHLDVEALKSKPLDIEECLTLFESQAVDATEDEGLRLGRASFALRQMLLSYLSDLAMRGGHTPTLVQFGKEILATQADVLTFNYDTVAEEAVAAASGIGPKPMPDSLRGDPGTAALADKDLDASHFTWRPALACGFQFDEVYLPVAGVPPYVNGARYYEHPNNTLYETTRVLKLHGSIDWLRYTDVRMYPGLEEEGRPIPRRGVVLDRYPSYWFGETPSKDMWRMEPMVVPPVLYKQLDQPPFRVVWDAALETLRECRILVVVGYSFPPTDFATKRLFLRAFSEHSLERLVVVDPNPDVVGVARRLTHFNGAVETCDSLRAWYGLPESWFDFADAAGSAQ